MQRVHAPMMHSLLYRDLRLAARRWPKRIEHRDARWLEVRDIARYYGKAMFEGSRRHRQIESHIADPLRQTAPTTGDCDIYRKNSTFISAQNRIEPCRQTFGEWWVELPLPFDPPLDFADSNDAHK